MRGLLFLLFYILISASLIISLISGYCGTITPYITWGFWKLVLPIIAGWDAFKITKKSLYKNNLVPVKVKRKDPWLAVFLSLLFPGLGFIYLRKWMFFLLYLFLGITIIWGISDSHIALSIAVLVDVLGIIHTYYLAAKNQKYSFRLITVFTVFFVLFTFFLHLAIPNFMNKYVVCGITPESGQSMEPTLRVNDQCVGSVIAYILDDPKPDDIVLTRNIYYRDREIPFIKRVVAVEGQTVHIKDFDIYVDGKKFYPGNQQFGEQASPKSLGYRIKSPDFYKFAVQEPYKVPPSCYFLLGDFLPNSLDSRQFGAVKRDEIQSKIIKILWPPSRMRVLK